MISAFIELLRKALFAYLDAGTGWEPWEPIDAATALVSPHSRRALMHIERTAASTVGIRRLRYPSPAPEGGHLHHDRC
jgi:hypothetical protein